LRFSLFFYNSFLNSGWIRETIDGKEFCCALFFSKRLQIKMFSLFLRPDNFKLLLFIAMLRLKHGITK